MGKNLKAKYQVYKDVAGKYRFRLWELMNLFGGIMYNGSPCIPFVKNELEIGE